jgi:hypothetical protein
MRQAFFMIAMGAGLACLLAACAPVRLQMPEGFAVGTAAWPVSGHSPRHLGEPLSFGPYAALEPEDGGTFSWSLPVARIDIAGSSREYAFILAAPAEAAVEVQCLVRSLALGHDTVNGRVESRTELDLTALRGPMLGCGLRRADVDDVAGPLLLALTRDGTRLHGRLESPWGEHEVRSLHGYEGTPIPAYGVNGFEVLRDGKVVMVVDMLNAGNVHMADDVDPAQRSWMAAAAAALLLLGDDAEA